MAYGNQWNTEGDNFNLSAHATNLWLFKTILIKSTRRIIRLKILGALGWMSLA